MRHIVSFVGDGEKIHHYVIRSEVDSFGKEALRFPIWKWFLLGASTQFV